MAEKKQTILIKNNTAGYLSNGSAPGSLIGIDALSEGETFSSPVDIITYNSETAQIEVTDTLSENKIGSDSIAIGDKCAAPSPNSLSVGANNLTAGTAGVALGHSNKATGYVSTALNSNNIASGNFSLATGSKTQANGQSSTSFGINTIANGLGSYTQGNATKSQGDYASACGSSTRAIGVCSSARGRGTTALGDYSSIEGRSINIAYDVINDLSSNTLDSTLISKYQEIPFSLAKGEASHVEGRDNIARSNYSHVEGQGNIGLLRDASHVQGRFCEIDKTGNYIHVVGNGTSDTDRKNIHTITKDGDAWYAGTLDGIDLKINSKSIQEQLYTEQLQTQEVLLDNLQLYNSENTLVVQGDIKKLTKDGVLTSVSTIQIKQIELLHSNWNNGIYDLTEYEGDIVLSYDASRGNNEIQKAYVNAEINNYGLENKIIALGDIPTVDIPVILKIEG